MSLNFTIPTAISAFAGVFLLISRCSFGKYIHFKFTDNFTVKRRNYIIFDHVTVTYKNTKVYDSIHIVHQNIGIDGHIY